MGYGQARFGGEAYGGARSGQRAGVGGIAVPGFDAVYYWTVAGGAGAYGRAAYGGRATSTFPIAGLAASPDPDTGIVTIPVWWAFASAAVLTRVDAATGERTPLRDSPARLGSGSRRNGSSNPKARDDLTGYTAGPNTTQVRLAGLTTPDPLVTTAVRLTASAAGSVSTAFSLDAVSTATTAHQLWVRSAATVTAMSLSVRWFDASSADLGVTTYPATVPLAQAATGWATASVVINTRPGTAVRGLASFTADGVAAAGWVDVTARLTELGAAVRGRYFDGDYPAAGWIGTPGLSYSDLAPVAYLVDAEVPLDRPVHYELTNPATPGFVASSSPVTLVSDRLVGTRQCLLTHPGWSLTVRVWLAAEPEVTNPLEQSAKKVIGRRRKVVVSDTQRAGDEGSMTFVAETFEERKRIKLLLDDGSPLLVRLPQSFGHPPLWWLSFGAATWKAQSHRSTVPLRTVTVSFVEVDRPSAATRPLVA